ncbi:hypothetical protein BASA81_005115 [Batrachochytrium salamandrivorans]|nr:hypothetical protein BASA81_005115 [Batrachochytrium salamandrivorans]
MALQENAQLFRHASADSPHHLRNLLLDSNRAAALQIECLQGVVLDFARTQATTQTKQLWLDLARETNLGAKIAGMWKGEVCNPTENRQVLHTALRCARDCQRYPPSVVGEVWDVIDRTFAYCDQIRSGELRGATGRVLKNVVSVGIGGSYLGPEFVHEALKFHPKAFTARSQRGELRFLANVDPVDVARAVEGLDPAETLVVVVSKTFTTAETMMNATTLRSWLLNGISGASNSESVVKNHMVAVSAAVDKANEFGIHTCFGFWDWVGGRYSVCSSVGLVPLALHYGGEIMHEFLSGAREMDEHFFTAELDANLPIMLALVSVWNTTFMGYSARAILPYSQALLRFTAHIQQVSMESNGKRVDVHGNKLVGFESSEIIFGEPGTNGQHSFYQLIHQGRIVPCDFIGIVQNQHPISQNGEVNHDELMSNFFAQPDALARGKTKQELEQEGVTESLVEHKVFEGNRPSISLLLPELDAKRIGQLLSLYENQVAAQGFLLGVNSFDQWGVELGKVLATKVRRELKRARMEAAATTEGKVSLNGAGFNPSTQSLMERFLNQ